MSDETNENVEEENDSPMFYDHVKPDVLSTFDAIDELMARTEHQLEDHRGAAAELPEGFKVPGLPFTMEGSETLLFSLGLHLIGFFSEDLRGATRALHERFSSERALMIDNLPEEEKRITKEAYENYVAKQRQAMLEEMFGGEMPAGLEVEDIPGGVVITESEPTEDPGGDPSSN